MFSRKTTKRLLQVIAFFLPCSRQNPPAPRGGGEREARVKKRRHDISGYHSPDGKKTIWKLIYLLIFVGKQRCIHPRGTLPNLPLPQGTYQPCFEKRWERGCSARKHNANLILRLFPRPIKVQD